VGETFSAEHAERYVGDYSGQQLYFKLGLSTIRSYKFKFCPLFFIRLIALKPRLAMVFAIFHTVFQDHLA
jgi:hypothetical protein